MSNFCTQPITMQTPKGAVTVTCRMCDNCRNSLITNFVGRCLLEADTAKDATFITLTYADNEEYGATEVVGEEQRGYRDFQNFLKRLRKHKYVIRYVSAMETGKNNTRRLHFHTIIFWQNKIPALPESGKRVMWELWPHGYTQIDPISVDRYGYVAKYMLKSQRHVEKGLPKASGAKRSPDTANQSAWAYNRMMRMQIAHEHGYKTWKDYRRSPDYQQENMVRWSKMPTFGLGHKNVPYELRPLAIMAKRLVQKGLPFSRTYMHPKGVYTAGGEQKRVKYFMENPSMVKEYYSYYCREYYLKYKKGDPPIRNTENEEGNTEREAVLKIVYGPRYWTHETNGLAIPEDSVAHVPFGLDEPRSSKNFKAIYEKVVYPRGQNKDPHVMLLKRKDGRIIAVAEYELQPEKYIGAYTDDQKKYDHVTAKGYRRWPVEDRRSLLALVRGSTTVMPLPTALDTKPEWNMPDAAPCPF